VTRRGNGDHEGLQAHRRRGPVVDTDRGEGGVADGLRRAGRPQAVRRPAGEQDPGREARGDRGAGGGQRVGQAAPAGAVGGVSKYCRIVEAGEARRLATLLQHLRCSLHDDSVKRGLSDGCPESTEGHADAIAVALQQPPGMAIGDIVEAQGSRLLRPADRTP